LHPKKEAISEWHGRKSPLCTSLSFRDPEFLNLFDNNITPIFNSSRVPFYTLLLDNKLSGIITAQAGW